VIEQIKPMLAQLASYGSLIATVLGVMFGGIVAVILLYKFASKVINPQGSYARMMKVAFGAIYAMVLVLTVLLAAEKIGLPVDGLGGPAILIVIVVSVVVFFAVPFLPRLPFATGDMVQIKDVIGIVEAMTAYQVLIRTFDGQTVFIPTALAMASPIRNFSSIPHRRIELDLELYAEDDIERARTILLETMAADERVINEPAPVAYVTGVTGERAAMVAFCWVANADWFATRDALWVALARAFADDDTVRLALPRLDVTGIPG
jgi:small conductance mechanosensitive channel